MPGDGTGSGIGSEPTAQNYDPSGAFSAFSALPYDQPAAPPPAYPLTRSFPAGVGPATSGVPPMAPGPAAGALGPRLPAGMTPAYPPTGYPAYGYPVPRKANGLSIAGFVCGLLGVVLAFAPYIGVILGIIGISLSVPGRNRAKRVGGPTGLATAGLVLGIIAVAVFLILLLFFVAAWGTFGLTGTN